MLKLTKDQVLARYNQLVPKTGRFDTPREGYYFIKEIFTSINYGIYMAKCCWKELESEQFNFDVEVTIQLMSIQESATNGQKVIVATLLNQEVHVSATYPGKTWWKGKEVPIVQCVWDLRSINFRSIKDIVFSELPDDLSLTSIVESFYFTTTEYVDYENSLIEGAYLADEGDDLYPVEDQDDNNYPDEDCDPDNNFPFGDDPEPGDQKDGPANDGQS